MIIYRVTRAFYPVIDGAACHTWYLSRSQAERGHKVYLFQPYAAGCRLGPPDVQVIPSVAAGLSRDGHRSKFAVLLLSISAALKVLFQARHARPHVIHVHGDAIDAFILGIAGRILRCPVVITIHGALNTRWLYRHSAPFLFRFVSRVITVGDSVAQSLAALGVNPARIESITSGIDVARFQDAPLGRAPCGRPKIVSVGRLHKVKGYEYLISAAKRLQESGHDCEVLIVGDGPERARLEALAYGVGNLKFYGEAERRDVAAILAHADIFVLASVALSGQAEGVPSAVMEAMAAGLPVVATRTGGIQEIVEHGVGGLLVPERAPDALAHALGILLNDSRLAREMGAHNRKAVQVKDWRFISDQITRSYGVEGDGNNGARLPARASMCP